MVLVIHNFKVHKFAKIKRNRARKSKMALGQFLKHVDVISCWTAIINDEKSNGESILLMNIEENTVLFE